MIYKCFFQTYNYFYSIMLIEMTDDEYREVGYKNEFLFNIVSTMLISLPILSLIVSVILYRDYRARSHRENEPQVKPGNNDKNKKPDNIIIRFQTDYGMYDLFEIRNERLQDERDVYRIINMLQKCHEKFIYGNYVYGTLCEFYDNLIFMGFNDLIIYDMTKPNDMIKGTRTFYVDEHMFNVSSYDYKNECVKMEEVLYSYFTNMITNKKDL